VNTLQFSSTVEGVLDVGVSNAAVLVGDVRTAHAALIDSERGTILGFEPVSRAWFGKVPILPDLHERIGTATALVGSHLFVIGGESAGTLRGDGWVIDVVSGAVTPWNFGLPARVHARLIPALDGAGLFFQGGLDPSGAIHDDVWLVEFTDAGTFAVRLLFPDSPSPGATGANASLFGASTDATLGGVHTGVA
jgi:hypothetical protein